MVLTSSDKIIIAHAALGGILAMIIWPGGALIGRYLRKYYPAWVRLHYIINGFFGAPILIVVFALGTYHKKGDANQWTTVHFRLGLVLLILGLLQSMYGWIIHLGRMKALVPITGWKSIVRYMHPITGITILALGFVQIYTGFTAWHHPGTLPHGILIAWGVLVALWSALYLGGMALIPSQWKQRKERAAMLREQDAARMEEKNRRDSEQPLNRMSADPISA